MREFRHRTDMLNSQAICFLYGLTDFGFGQLRKVGGFPEPTHFRIFASDFPHQSPLNVVYWRRSAVAEYMRGVGLEAQKKARRASRRRR